MTASAGGTTSTAVTVSTAAASDSCPSRWRQANADGRRHHAFSITANPGTNGAPIQNVTVDYGDGTSDELGSVIGHVISVQHVYGDDGTFRPTVTATDTSGQTATASTVIVVQPILVSITATQSPTDPKTFNFTANVSPQARAIASYAWTFGDGSSHDDVEHCDEPHIFFTGQSHRAGHRADIHQPHRQRKHHD